MRQASGQQHDYNRENFPSDFHKVARHYHHEDFHSSGSSGADAGCNPRQMRVMA
jgi:hypothetical protein